MYVWLVNRQTLIKDGWDGYDLTIDMFLANMGIVAPMLVVYSRGLILVTTHYVSQNGQCNPLGQQYIQESSDWEHVTIKANMHIVAPRLAVNSETFRQVAPH